jgi:hypothetical protein
VEKYVIKLDDNYVCGTQDDSFYKIEGGFNNGFHQSEICYLRGLEYE